MTTEFSPQRGVPSCSALHPNNGGFSTPPCSWLRVSSSLFSALLLALWGWAYCITQAALPVASLSSANERHRKEIRRAQGRDSGVLLPWFHPPLEALYAWQQSRFSKTASPGLPWLLTLAGSRNRFFFTLHFLPWGIGSISLVLASRCINTSSCFSELFTRLLSSLLMTIFLDQINSTSYWDPNCYFCYHGCMIYLLFLPFSSLGVTMRFWFVFSLHSELSEDQVRFSLRMPAINSQSIFKSNGNLYLLRMSLSSGPKSAGFLAKSTLRLTYPSLRGVKKLLQWCPGLLIEILRTQVSGTHMKWRQDNSSSLEKVTMNLN